MRIRGTKPEFWRSKLIASVPWDARFVLKALESYVDDNGVGEDDVNVLAGDCFLHDLIREPSLLLARVSEAISQLHQAGLVWRYEANGRNLLYVSFWETVQRIDKPLAGRNPRPDGTLNYKDSVIRESSRGVATETRVLAPVTGEQSNRGTGEQGNSSLVHDKHALVDEFAQFWSEYPRKQAKPDALKAFKAARKTTDLETILAGLSVYKLANIGTDKSLIKMPAGWLRSERWADEVTVATTAPPRSSAPAECYMHDGYPMPCEKCEREGNPF